MKDAVDKLSGVSFTLLNVLFGGLSLISAAFPPMAYVSLLVLLCFLALWIVSFRQKGAWYLKNTAKGRIEAEVGIYSSFLVWFSVYCIFVTSLINVPAAEDPLFALTIIGIVGWLVSALPLSKIIGSGG